MKKLISVILTSLILLYSSVASVAYVSADNGDKVAELILSAKEKFDISDDRFVFENYNKNDYNEDVLYYLSWKSKDGGEYSDQSNISVRISENGHVEYYCLNKNYSHEIALRKFTDDEIIAKATQYIEKIAPDRVRKLAGAVIDESTHPTVQFERIENGIPVSGDSISVELSPDDLSLIRYSANWTNVQFPDPDGILTKEDAKNAYINNIGYELLYNIKTKNNQIDDIYLSYESKDSSAFIDAFSGDALKHTGVVYKTSSGAMNDTAATEETRVSLSPEEQKMVDEINKMISKEDAEAIARAVPEFNIRSNAQVTGYRVYQNSYGDYIANINFSFSTKDDYYSAGVSINALTKEIMSFSESEKIENTKQSHSTEQAKKTAEEFLNKYYGDKFSKVQPDFVIGEPSRYRFAYDRYEDGVRVKNNGLNISVNEYTGQISNFSCSWADTRFPEKSNVVSPRYIYNEVLADDNFRLQYVTTTEYTYNEENGKETRKTTASLVYTPIKSPVYDALTADEINLRGQAVTEKFAGYSDLNGHYSETAATELARIGIYFEGGKLSADSEITQIEFLKFVYRIVYGSYYGDDSDIYRSLIQNGIITEDEIGAPLTRINAIRYLINALGFKDAAKIQGIYNCPFTDVPTESHGYAAIVGGIGIINTRTEIFRPDHIMTRGEAVTVIFNYLKKD